ncbi:S-layer homology domain-containing protein [Lysinibacillus sp. LZ02]|uniref:S-layer homology domain-containing protein n=1 Tax=Lysinibacillus sp. LZ02 TaxID=3420668 RepID=UPI003D35A6D5
MRVVKWVATLLLAFQLVVSPAAAMTGNEGEPAHYVALGDSLAAGIIETGEIGQGYADYLAQMLEEEHLLASYNKGFAFPGYTTEDVLKELKSDVVKPSSETAEQVSLLDEVKKADVITISIGANDVLKNLTRNEAGEMQFDEQQVKQAIERVLANYDAILKRIAQLNPTADVFVMGYYNPFPYVEGATKQLNFLVTVMDTAIQRVVELNDMYFVKVADVVASDVKAYLPNPQNIHLSEAGYEAVADQFAGPVLEYIMLMPLPEVLLDFTDIPQDNWAYPYAVGVAEYGLMKGYSDGTFKPNDSLTRVQITSILARALQLEATAAVPFKDMTTYAIETQSEVAAAYEAEIVKGAGTLFKPSEKITRAEVAMMMHRAYIHITGEQYEPTQVAPFTDIETYNDEYKQAITFLYDFDIATGVGNTGKFNPAGYLTRAQAAKIIVNFYETVVLED